MLSHIDKTHRLLVLLATVFFGLLIVIGALKYADNRQLAASRQTGEAIHSLRIQRPEFADIQLQLVDGQWLIREPCELTANTQRLEPLLGALRPAQLSYEPNDVDLDAAGLTEPLATVFLNDTRIDIGKTDLNGNRRYIKRNNQIEFAPEWILSLLNGGLSAMANLTVFDSDISAIEILDDSNTRYSVSADSIADWQDLSAQQIVSWPLPPDEPALITQSLEVQQGGMRRLLKIYTYSRFSALHYENEQCAFLLNTQSLPDTSPDA